MGLVAAMLVAAACQPIVDPSLAGQGATATASSPLQGTPEGEQEPIPGVGPALATISADSLRVRNAPNDEAEVVAGVRSGESYPVIAISSDGAWLQLEVERAAEGLGWVASSFVTLEGDITSIPIVEVEAADAEGTPAPTEEPGEEATPEPTEEAMEEATPEPTEEPAEEATPEPTEEPAEEATPAPTEEPAEEATPEPTEEPAAEAGAAVPVTADDVANATITGVYTEPVTLVDGVYEGEPVVEGSATVPTLAVIPDSTAFGDLNGDGVDDAAVLLVENSGGSGSFVYLAALTGAEGAVTNVATTLLGDRVQPQSISIADGQIVVVANTFAESDPMCCPSLQSTLTFALEGNELALVDQVDTQATEAAAEATPAPAEEATEEATPEPTEEAAEEVTPPAAGFVTVNTDGTPLRVRSAPTTEEDNKIGNVFDGETYRVLEVSADGEWIRIEVPEIDAENGGWVSAEFVVVGE
jgi:outer membrane biosynthesis protein TonB